MRLDGSCLPYLVQLVPTLLSGSQAYDITLACGLILSGSGCGFVAGSRAALKRSERENGT